MFQTTNPKVFAGGDMVRGSDLVVTAVYRRTARKYRERAVQYVHFEAGQAAQNVCLMAVALGLGAATVGAFDDVGVQRLLVLSDEEQPLYLLAVGKVAR